jgi:hypothetical protein
MNETLTPQPLRGANIDFVDVPLPCEGEGEPWHSGGRA